MPSPQTTAVRATLVLLASAFITASYGADFVRFQDSGQRFGTMHHLTAELADFDGDGDLDAWVGNYVQPSTLWENDGTGTFTLLAELGLALSSRVVLEDFNQDGNIDAFVVSHGVFTQLWFGDGAGGFSVSEQHFGSAGVQEAEAGDLDGDGDIDLFMPALLGFRNAAFFNDGSGFFTPGDTSGLGSARTVALGDVDADGDLDAFLGFGGTVASPNRVLLNDGSGRFSNSGQLLGVHHTTVVKLADLDGDGDLDAVTGNNDFFDHDPANRVWLNDGSGNFADSGQRLGEGRTTDVDLADLDGDGDLDVLVAESLTTNEVWLNDGSGRLAAATNTLGDTEFDSQSAVGDLDGDGDLDILSAVSGENRVYFSVLDCFGDLDGDDEVGLSDLAQVLANFGAPSGVSYEDGDLDGDGDVDLSDLAALLAVYGNDCG
jgi:hypothetical protein